MKKLKRKEKIGMLLGVFIVIFGSFLEHLESKLGVIPNRVMTVGFVLIICLLIYINYGREKEEDE